MQSPTEPQALEPLPGDSAGTRQGALSARGLAWLLILGASVGWVSAFVLLVEKVALIRDPAYIPSCSINPTLSCSSIMDSAQAEVFGFPNPILGVAGFAVVVTVGVSMRAGATFRPWFWLGLQGGTVAGAAFVHWLIFQSLYRIGALCPYCMVVWAVTIPLAWYVTVDVAARLGGRRLQRLAAGGAAYHGAILTAWFLVVAGLVLNRFWTYWMTLLP